MTFAVGWALSLSLSLSPSPHLPTLHTASCPLISHQWERLMVCTFKGVGTWKKKKNTTWGEVTLSIMEQTAENKKPVRRVKTSTETVQKGEVCHLPEDKFCFRGWIRFSRKLQPWWTSRPTGLKGEITIVAGPHEVLASHNAYWVIRDGRKLV